MGRSKKNQTKQERERAVFEMFASSFELPAGAISYGDKPDVIIDGARKIGIEITHLYHVDGDDPDSEQVQRRNRKAVVEQAQRLQMNDHTMSTAIAAPQRIFPISRSSYTGAD
ncbi:hypothetical protein ACS0ZG_32490 [Burkholderia gladioli]|uniref:hypothetical protein n=1 Tax=Burkholderia gladioli TaxID=28095 RepID=UPI0016414F5E|nr:hypothetical protein [Burkholderia gladioli]